MQGEVHKPARTVAGDTTLDINDLGGTVLVSAAATITVPPDVFPVGARFNIGRTGTGDVVLAGGAGVTLLSKEGHLTLVEQYSGVTLEQVSANTFWLVGDLSTP